jgi:hypothetical protein
VVVQKFARFSGESFQRTSEPQPHWNFRFTSVLLNPKSVTERLYDEAEFGFGTLALGQSVGFHNSLRTAVSLIERGQKPGHQAAPLNETVNLDVFIERVIIGTANAQAIEGRNPHRASEIAVGTTTRAAVDQVETK